MWRGWLTLNSGLTATLQRDLQDDAGLSMHDFEVLVHLTDYPDGRVRVTDLARLLHWERSRVSHHVTRMQRPRAGGAGGVPRRRPRRLHRRHPRRAHRDRAGRPRARAGRAAAVFDALDEDDVDRFAAVIDKMLAAQAE